MLFVYCQEYIAERISTAEQALVSAREASENDTKSSAGDKYETTREMMQQEINRIQGQLAEARKLKFMLSSVIPEKEAAIVQNGCLVQTDTGNFFIAISAGQCRLDDILYFIISNESPFARAIAGRKAGDSVQFNNKKVTIISIT